jgi:hypothetical protein
MWQRANDHFAIPLLEARRVMVTTSLNLRFIDGHVFSDTGMQLPQIALPFFSKLYETVQFGENPKRLKFA